MGVKNLWNIISPSSDRRPIHELQGKVIAIDLSGWIVDSQSVTENVVQPKMYLRNLFFRTAFLLMHEISPVFVLEGTAPSLKHKTIARRHEIRNGPPEKKTNKKGGRSNFNRILKECEEMLKYMGISCIRGQGEAEAMCALLNAEGLVDGCVSQDSDCFLYGAKVVYRNFCMSTQGNRGTSGGSIDEYTIDKIERVYGLGRNKMISLALLCGCDYDDGINGVGKEAALKLFKIVGENKILERMKSWKTDSLFDRMEAELANPNICTTCGHQGKMRVHLKSGCIDCGTLTKCNDTYKEKRVLMSNELSIRKKALLVEDFPNEELINEFLYCKDPTPSSLNLQWKQPQVLKFVNFMEKCVMWETEYAYAKVLPLLTRWQVRHISKIPDDFRLSLSDLLIPEKIRKLRNIKGVISYEIEWKDETGLFKGMALACISDKENNLEKCPASPTELATLEPQHLFQKCYPDLVQEFENAKLAKKKKPTKSRAKKAKCAEDDATEKVEKKKAQRRPRKPKTTENLKNKKIDEFITRNAPTLEESFEALTITPKRKKKGNNIEDEVKSFPTSAKRKEIERLDQILNGSLLTMFNELTPEDFPSDADDENMSEIIQNICSPTYAMDTSSPKNQRVDCMSDLESYSPIKSIENCDAVTKPIIGLKNRDHFPKPINLSTNIINANDKSDNLNCTLKRLIDSHKNVSDYRKKPFSIIKSPNIFAKSEKSKRKFDLVNFTFERQDSPESRMSEKVPGDCKRRSSYISNLIKSKSPICDDSMEKIDRINASLERFLFGQKLSNDFKVPEKSFNKGTNISEVSQLKTPDLRNLRRKSNFSLERSLHVQNLIKDFENSVSNTTIIANDSNLKMSNEGSSADEIDIANSSLERLRFSHHLDMNFENYQVENEEENSNFDISKFKLSEENKSIDHMDVMNSTFERLQIFQKSEDLKITEKSVEILDGDEEDKNKEDIQNSDTNRNKKIIPDEIELTDESDLFDSTGENSQMIQSPEMHYKNREQSVRKTNIVRDELKLLEKDNSMDEFDILIADCKPFDERLDLQKSKIARTSSPDFIATTNKKFSFGIDDLLNDTDL